MQSALPVRQAAALAAILAFSSFVAVSLGAPPLEDGFTPKFIQFRRPGGMILLGGASPAAPVVTVHTMTASQATTGATPLFTVTLDGQTLTVPAANVTSLIVIADPRTDTVTISPSVKVPWVKVAPCVSKATGPVLVQFPSMTGTVVTEPVGDISEIVPATATTTYLLMPGYTDTVDLPFASVAAYVVGSGWGQSPGQYVAVPSANPFKTVFSYPTTQPTTQPATPLGQ